MKNNWVTQNQTVVQPKPTNTIRRGSRPMPSFVGNNSVRDNYIKAIDKRQTNLSPIFSTKQESNDSSNKQTRGYRNNNPLNLRVGGATFDGEIKGQDKAFRTFKSMEDGYRAGFVTIGTYLQNGHNTLEKIVSRWAPSNENNTKDYIESVSNRTGIPKNKVLSVNDGVDIIKIVKAKSFYENSIEPLDEHVMAGFESQSKIKLNRNGK